MAKNATSTTSAPQIFSLHHSALRCIDAEETRQFYEDVLGIPLAAACIFDHNGIEPMDYMHLFHRMAGGDFVAFFDSPSAMDPDLFSPYTQLDMRVGFTVSSEADLAALEDRLTAAGVEFTGPIDHGYVKSIYFKDPSGLNLEFVAKSPRHEEILAEEKARATSVLADWIANDASGEATRH